MMRRSKQIEVPGTPRAALSTATKASLANASDLTDPFTDAHAQTAPGGKLQRKATQRASKADRPSLNAPWVEAPCRVCGREVGLIASPEHWSQPRDVCWRCALDAGLTVGIA